jgi:hypothetical protein
MSRALQIAVTLFLLLSISHAQNKNQIIGHIFYGGESARSDEQLRPLEGILVRALDSEKKLINVSQLTNKQGKFFLVVPPNIRVFRILVSDPNSEYWMYEPNGVKPNNADQQDLGKIYLYPRSFKLNGSQIQQQIAAAQTLEKFDKKSADKFKIAVFSEYPMEVRSQIQNALQTDPELSSTNIHVSVNAENIELSGTVPHDQEKQTAKRIAQNHVGDERVKDYMVVRTAMPASTPPK